MALQKLEGTFVSKEQKEKIKERQDKASAMQQAYGETSLVNSDSLWRSVVSDAIS